MNEAKKFREAMALDALEQGLERAARALEGAEGSIMIRAEGPCHCGCGRPSRVVLDTRGEASFFSPGHLDELIRMLEKFRAAAWGAGK